MAIYIPTEKELNWFKKNELLAHSVPGVQSWYENENHYIHSEKTFKIIATHEFTVYTCCSSDNCDLIFRSDRIDNRSGELLYKVEFREDIVGNIEDAFVKLEAKIKRFPDKKIYELFNSVFMDKAF